MSEEIEILLAAKNFHETLERLLDALDEEWISQSQGRMRPGGKLDLASLSQSVFFEQFRFTYAEVEQLVIHLDLPAEFKCPQTRITEDAFTAVCMLLRRLSSPPDSVMLKCSVSAPRKMVVICLFARGFSRCTSALRWPKVAHTSFTINWMRRLCPNVPALQSSPTSCTRAALTVYADVARLLHLRHSDTYPPSAVRCSAYASPSASSPGRQRRPSPARRSPSTADSPPSALYGGKLQEDSPLSPPTANVDIRFRKRLRDAYRLAPTTNPTHDAPDAQSTHLSRAADPRLWSVATGTWEHPKWLHAAHLLPQCFGDDVVPPQRPYGPECLGSAIDDGAITLAPDVPDHQDTRETRQLRWGPSVAGPVSEWKFRVWEPENVHLQYRLTLQPQKTRARVCHNIGRDLDGLRVQFVEGCRMRPSVQALYFLHWCAAMRRRQMFEVDGTRPENAAWRELIRLLRELEGDAPVALDWSMDLGQSSVQTRC
ncbi:hypothetical protein K438DRAFT_1989661 [Mycena galopus ATCC 62051]|nr:hypothetical protein K438DRAFT_1989661 [Mycena galopus ATCC 62051]